MFIQKIVKYFLANRTFMVQIDGKISAYRKILAGVPQGSVL